MAIRGIPLRAARDIADPPASDRRAWAALTACLLAVFMQMLDLTIVNTALPVLAHDLSATGSTQLLVVTVYGVAFAGTLLTAARLGDRFGRRRLFLIGMTVFTTASLGCGLARLPIELVAGRVAQGVGAAAVSAQTIAIVAAAFSVQRRPLVFGVYGAVAGLAGLSGPLLGGLIVALNPGGLGWRSIFLLNLPLGLIALVLAARYLDIGRAERAVRVDVPGAVLSMVGVAAVLYPLSTGRDSGWPLSAVGLLVAGLVVLAVFGWRQWRVTVHGGTPLISGEVFRDKGFSIGSVLLLVFYGLFAALLFTVSMTAQTGMGWSAWQTARLLLPFALGALLAALTSPILVARLGSRALTAGIALFALGVAQMALTVHPASGGVDTRALSEPVLLAGAGMGWFAAPLPAIMVAGLGQEPTGSASGLAPTVQQLGSAIGAAVLGSVFFARIAAGSGVDGAKSLLAQHLSDRDATPGERVELVRRFGDCAHAAFASPSHVLPVDGCAGAFDATVASAATAPTFLQACVTVLWIVAAVAGVLTALTLALPRRPEARP
ncbi:MFS transporter [Nocardia macrotermitis]|uniref:Multidrug resistance protein Stp n=1 Tax=Nocardia macrotermitis TaxID=2585198 RepID=A0A7K0CUG0_9NOCA|nr:MFS transporter [Nocardia macrotermitis]MQY17119.1 Multidrug resistance protein Stp [Nocardia macrotermitis]